ncbi:MAG: hypothetical protein KF835_15840 [Xanthobacteraceae bacterium]|nr:hypothetical protein [Xanthobacteraceae bacterium]
MSLQNRVTPFGELIAAPVHGDFLGNRGGRFHRDDRTLGARRHYVSKAWICCVLAFRGRQRDVWGRSYTELFFLDEPTALAAGHRPCFECRRAAATAFAQKFSGGAVRASAGEMDGILHRERLTEDRRTKKMHPVSLDDLPDGVFVTLSGKDAFAVNGKRLLRWSPGGYVEAIARPLGRAMMLTPPAIRDVLARGYAPHWHPSAASL